MSHTMTMAVLNQSDKTLSAYKVTHSWDGNINSCTGENLLQNKSSSAVTIISGYTEYDYYDVSVTFDDGSTFNTNFYCNSSYDQDAVVIQISNNSCNCVYYKNGGVETGCYDKG